MKKAPIARQELFVPTMVGFTADLFLTMVEAHSPQVPGACGQYSLANLSIFLRATFLISILYHVPKSSTKENFQSSLKMIFPIA